MRRHLFQPFQFSQWIRLAIVGFLAGELGSGGGLGVRSPSGPIPQQGPVLQGMRLPFGGGALFILAIGVLVLLALILTIVFVYISCRMRFVLFDSVLNGRCRIRDFWRQRGDVAFQYFVFQLLFLLCTFIGMVLLFGIAFGFAFGMGWFSNPGNHLLPLLLGGGVVVLIFLLSLIAIGLVQVLVKDFVIPQMAFENVSVGEGWRRLWAMMKTEKGGYAGYIGMKIVLSLVTAILLGVAALVVILLLLIPVGGVGAITVLAGRAAGLTWNPLTVAIAIVAVGIVLIALIAIAALISVPAIVFFPAYSMHFFAERYPALRTALNSPPSNPDLGTVPT